MQEDIDLALEAAEEGMQNSIVHFQRELLKIRSGKATPQMVADVKVEYYGMPTPLNQVAGIKTTDARTLVIQPFEKKMVSVVEQALYAANLGITPQSDGEVVRMVVPPLTEERRKQLVKQASGFAEDAKVSIRNARRDAIQEVKAAVKEGYPEDAGKRSEQTVQDLTDKYSKQVDSIFAKKEEELMTV
ncbi:ribosome recycling factor [Saprospira grandis]|uniref:ribosome recycling factor n=1 Tax=Saprospira grandis TaxID=1008 RepID=UPI0022DDE98E|nr:ribosome recycling factor [Saprospira grandis]WBM75933.1 ribosome recycling factor [Saprospira grandis]